MRMLLYWEQRHCWLCDDLLINLGASVDECRKAFALAECVVAEFMDVGWTDCAI